MHTTDQQLAAAPQTDAAPALNHPTPATPVAATTPPDIGQYWPGQGGRYAGALRNRDTGDTIHVIVAANEIIESIPRAEWGGYAHETPISDSVWNGEANHFALLADSEEHPAAQACVPLTIDGHNDFRLPSKAEAALILANLGDQIPEGWYWTNTQYSSGYAWDSYFPDGGQLVDLKDYKGRVLPVRTVLAI